MRVYAPHAMFEVADRAARRLKARALIAGARVVFVSGRFGSMRHYEVRADTTFLPSPAHSGRQRITFSPARKARKARARLGFVAIKSWY